MKRNMVEYYEDGRKICPINDYLNIVLVSKSNEKIIWDEVFLDFGTEIRFVGNCINDLARGFSSWLDFNENCIIFYSGNEILHNYFIDRVFDIKKRQFVNLSIDEIERLYNIDILENETEDRVLLSR